MNLIFRLTAIFLAVSFLFCGSIGMKIHAATDELEPLLYEAYADRLISASYTDDNGCTLPYLLYLPEDYAERACPVILSLHGAGERGCDNRLQAQGGILPYILADAELANEAILLLPQCPEEGQWVDVPWSIGVYFTEDVPESPYLACALSLLDKIVESCNADPDRLYATGYSMGGYGTWDILARHPELLAAALPLCGGGDSSKAALYRSVPIKTYHCTEDGIVPFIGTQAIVEGIKAIGGDKIDFIVIESASHDAWTPAYSNPDTLRWLLSQRKKMQTEMDEIEKADEINVIEESKSVTEDAANLPSETETTDQTDDTAETKSDSGIAALIAVGAFIVTAALLSCALLFRRESFYT